MDLTTLLVIAVAVLIVSSAYFLFNGLPQVGRNDGRARHSARRS